MFLNNIRWLRVVLLSILITGLSAQGRDRNDKYRLEIWGVLNISGEMSQDILASVTLRMDCSNGEYLTSYPRLDQKFYFLIIGSFEGDCLLTASSPFQYYDDVLISIDSDLGFISKGISDAARISCSSVRCDVTIGENGPKQFITQDKTIFSVFLTPSVLLMAMSMGIFLILPFMESLVSEEDLAELREESGVIGAISSAISASKGFNRREQGEKFKLK